MKFSFTSIAFMLFFLSALSQNEPLMSSSLHGNLIKNAIINNQNEAIISIGLDGKIYTTLIDSTFEVIDSLVNSNSPINDLSHSRDGKYLLTAHQDGIINRYFVDKLEDAFQPLTFDTVFNLVPGQQIQKVLYGVGLRSFLFTTKESKVYTYNFSNKKLFIIKTEEPVNALNTSIDQMKVFVAGTNTPTIIEYDIMGKEIRKFIGHQDIVNEIILTADRKYMISASSDKTIKIWNLQNGKLEKTLTGHEWRITGLVIDPRNNYMASSCLDGIVFIWDYKKLEVIDTFELKNARCLSVSISPNMDRVVVTYVSDGNPKGGFKMFKSSVLPPVPERKVAKIEKGDVRVKSNQKVNTTNQKNKGVVKEKKAEEEIIQKTEELEIRREK